MCKKLFKINERKLGICMIKLLMEIGCEDLPTGEIDKAKIFLKNNFIKKSNHYNIRIQMINSYTTHKRIILLIKFQDKRDSLKKNILKDILKDSIKNIPWKKNMKWNKSKYYFSRPIRWILCILSDKIFPISFASIKSNNITYGNNAISNNKIKILSIKSYLNQLKKNFVIIDQLERKKILKEKLKKLTLNIHGKLLLNEYDLEIIKNISEYPDLILCKFHKSLRTVPEEIIQLEIKKYQIYLPIYDKKSNITRYFVTITSNPIINKNKASKDYSNLLSDKLKILYSYYKEGYITSFKKKKLLLKSILFHHKIGNIYGKVNRITNLSRFILKSLNLQKFEKSIIRTTKICKTDLTSSLVIKFPKLHGIIGKKYAIGNNENKNISISIKEHLLPRFSKDLLPILNESNIISIADKIDTISSMCLYEKLPTGTHDPFFLKRMAIGIIRIMIKQSYNISLKKIIQKSLILLSKSKKNENKIIIFFITRIRIFLIELFKKNKINKSIINASINASHRNIFDVYSRIKSINYILKKNKNIFEKTLILFKRSNQIIKKSKIRNLILMKKNNYKLLNKLEINLIENLLNIETKIFNIQKNDLLSYYINVIKIIMPANQLLGNFFEKVKIMDNDLLKKNEKLKILFKYISIFRKIANFSIIKV